MAEDPRPRPRPISRPQVAPQQVAAAAGDAVVSAARVGRLVGRSGWRLAKQLPGAGIVGAVLAGGAPEEKRAMALLHNAATEAEPLRSAMSALLERSNSADRGRSNEYLYGTIVSQLVPDEARILAALTGGREFAAVDVVVKPSGRASSYVELANESTVGSAAGVAVPRNTGTYLSRLHAFGLVEFSAPGEELDSQFDLLREDPTVQRARSRSDTGKTRAVRKRVTLSKFGAEFWAACAPRQGDLSRRRT